MRELQVLGAVKVSLLVSVATMVMAMALSCSEQRYCRIIPRGFWQNIAAGPLSEWFKILYWWSCIACMHVHRIHSSESSSTFFNFLQINVLYPAELPLKVASYLPEGLLVIVQ